MEGLSTALDSTHPESQHREIPNIPTLHESSSRNFVPPESSFPFDRLMKHDVMLPGP
jgi:hypothetical protein